jgi:NADH-quinone oxidoreductase subunit K
MNAVGLESYLIIGAILFGMGIVGFLTRRNLIVMFLCAEMMLQGVGLNFVAFARFHGNLQGQAFVLFIIAVAACEAAISLALILMLYRRKQSLDVSLWQDMHEAGWQPAEDEEPLPAVSAPEPLPQLPPAGKEPIRKEVPTHV